MSITRASLRAAARAFNQGPHQDRLWADVLSLDDQQGSSLTLYRKVRGEGTKQVEPLARWTIASDEAQAAEPVDGYGVGVRPDERLAVDDLVAAIRPTGD